METKNGKCFSSQIYIIIWSFRAQIIYLVFYATDYPMLFPMSFPPLLHAYECRLSLGYWSSLSSSQKPFTEPLSSKEPTNFPFLSLIGSSNFLLVSLGIFLHMHVLSLTGNPSVRKHLYEMSWETQVKHISSHQVYTLSSDGFLSSCSLFCNWTCGKYY